MAIWFNDKVALNNNGDYHWLWFIPIQSVFNDCIRNNIIDTRGYIVQGNGVIAQASGSFHSSMGLNMRTIAHEEPLNSRQQGNVTQILISEIDSEYQPIPAKVG